MDRAIISRRDAFRLFGIGAAALLQRSAVTRDFDATSSPPRPAMLTRTISSAQETLPVIGLGTWQTFDAVAPVDLARLGEILATFAELGGRVIDSSPMYGRSEEVVGQLLTKAGLRSRLFVATKVWIDGRQAGIEQMETSLQKLAADPIDLLQVHNLVDVRTHLETLRAWKREGRVRYLGVTHYTASQHNAVAKLVETESLDFIQINYSAAEREAERTLLPLARDRGVAVIANRPFAGGEIFRRLRTRALPPWAGEIDCKSWAQLLLKFIIAHPAITCAIPATDKIEHLRENMAAGRGALPDERMREKIAEAVTG